jgi:undecaprenyl-phosphate 4-deoxy-4-formamido-L-arabinose transferase
MKDLSIVIPVYNAELSIEPLCTELISRLGKGARLEIVLVNDFSSDTSDAICHRLRQAHPSVVSYLALSRNFGEHNAVMAGLNHTRGKVIVIMDDDFQNPPEEVEKLLAELANGHDVVYCHYKAKRDNLFRNFGSWVNDVSATLVLKKPKGIYLSSFKAMNRFLVDEVIKNKVPDPYIDAIILRSTANIGSIEVRHEPRRYRRSGYTLKKLLALWGNMLVSYSLIPLRFMALLGFVMTIIGMIYGGKTVIDWFHPSWGDPTDYEKLTAATMFFRGFQLLATGIVGEYVGRNYLALHRDPQYIVREFLPADESSPDGTPHRRATD